MKSIIIFLLMNCFLCSGSAHLKAFSSLSSGSTIMDYVDISKFDQNDSMHLAIVVISGKIDKIINYGYSDEKSISPDLLSYTKKPTSSESFCGGGDDDYENYCGNRYYYDIKKEENKKYIVIQSTGYTGKSIEYSFLPMSAIGFYLMYFAIFVVCIVICCIYGCYYSHKKAKEYKSENADRTSMIPNDSQNTSDNY